MLRRSLVAISSDFGPKKVVVFCIIRSHQIAATQHPQSPLTPKDVKQPRKGSSQSKKNALTFFARGGKHRLGFTGHREKQLNTQSPHREDLFLILYLESVTFYFE